MATRKPRQNRSKVTVDTIIEAGFIAVAANGTSGTTTRHIADIAGVSVGSLYEYFKNKEEIYDAMAKSFVKEVLDMVKELTPIIVEMELEPLFQMIFIRSEICSHATMIVILYVYAMPQNLNMNAISDKLKWH